MRLLQHHRDPSWTICSPQDPQDWHNDEPLARVVEIGGKPTAMLGEVPDQHWAEHMQKATGRGFSVRYREKVSEPINQRLTFSKREVQHD